MKHTTIAKTLVQGVIRLRQYGQFVLREQGCWSKEKTFWVRL